MMQKLAAQHRMVIIVPVYEETETGVYYNTAAVFDADGSYLGKYHKTHIPQVAGFWRNSSSNQANQTGQSSTLPTAKLVCISAMTAISLRAGVRWHSTVLR